MDYQKNYEKWLNDPRLSAEGKAELKAIASDEKAKEYRFGGELEFGTAGMRGIIGFGMNMMNVYTVTRRRGWLPLFWNRGRKRRPAAWSFLTIREENRPNLQKRRRECLRRTA